MPIFSGGGGGAGIGTVLYSQTLSGSAANLDSGTFATSLHLLQIFAYVRGTQAASTVNAQVTFNGDTGANYDYMVSGGQNVTPSAGNVLAGTAWLPAVIAANGLAGNFSALTIVMPQYAGTTGRKAANVLCGAPDASAAANMIVQTLQGVYRSTSPVSRVTITPSAGQWAAGSSLVVIGF